MLLSKCFTCNAHAFFASIARKQENAKKFLVIFSNFRESFLKENLEFACIGKALQLSMKA
ncbi:predicted protein [Enterococcus gallinarum EG2]|nr:predicted protein [Enterococcus gallinarum EG2]